MCGFAGIADNNHLEVNQDLDSRMKLALKSLHPRGPDQEGTLIDDNFYFCIVNSNHNVHCLYGESFKKNTNKLSKKTNG